MLFLGFILTLWPILFVLLYIVLNHIAKPRHSVCIIVLGDLGRSPRMLYHAKSFAKEGYEVDLVGYSGSKLHEDIQINRRISRHYLWEPPIFVKYVPRLLAYVLKVFWQSTSLGLQLLFLPKANYLLIQNPPSIPTLFVALIVCLLRGSFLLIDWHNYGFTILALTLGGDHPLVKFSKWYEKFFGRFSKANLCVTKAMRDDLKTWGISAETLYDRPADLFQEATVEERHDLFSKLSLAYPIFGSRNELEQDSTVFTYRSASGKIQYRNDRPALLVSSTSWTEDEDFGILLKTLQSKYEAVTSPEFKFVQSGRTLKYFCKGPLKEFYSQEIDSIEWKHIHFCLPWLEAEDYPVLLGSADLGVCLHMSSSGLDLPMKVVDMFGCGLPVCAVHYPCLSELVKHGHSGLIFKSSQELCNQLQELLESFPDDQKTLKKMRCNLKSFQAIRWHDNWKRTVLPLLKQHRKDKKKR
ncbi:Chitobiosyldiphosphodolichol beta-mannosyltransferase [Mizuhopecten yessoensis]|uniref:Beta-1,4-mannosyltransferase n=1 Tax=Mizuhopecten yessoensis TaxID=6573 RepID=A0A210QCK8_MIZYE|nr:Chitobiosyldiphosphodolichol beta-mannosyltransferase [Mizuhopecten yessoensis]